MDRVALVVGALIGGTAAASSPGATPAVDDAMQVYRGLLRARLGQVRTEFTLRRYEEDPKQWRRAIGELVAEMELDKDPEIVAAAQRIMRLVDPDGAADGHYQVETIPPTA